MSQTGERKSNDGLYYRRAIGDWCYRRRSNPILIIFQKKQQKIAALLILRA